MRDGYSVVWTSQKLGFGKWEYGAKRGNGPDFAVVTPAQGPAVCDLHIVARAQTFGSIALSSSVCFGRPWLSTRMRLYRSFFRKSGVFWLPSSQASRFYPKGGNYYLFVTYFPLPLRCATFEENLGASMFHLKMYFLLKIGIFQCHVSFQGCICWIYPKPTQDANSRLYLPRFATIESSGPGKIDTTYTPVI